MAYNYENWVPGDDTDYEREKEYIHIDDVEKEYVHIDQIPDLDAAKNTLRMILQGVYVTGDIPELEKNLNKLCEILGLNSLHLFHDDIPVIRAR